MIAPTQHLPTIDLRFDGSELRVTLGPEVKAERIGPGNRLTRVWPRDRLLPPSFIGSERAVPTGHVVAECVLPHGYTWSSIFRLSLPALTCCGLTFPALVRHPLSIGTA